MTRKKLLALTLAATIGITAVATTAGAGLFGAGWGEAGRTAAAVAHRGDDDGGGAYDDRRGDRYGRDDGYGRDDDRDGARPYRDRPYRRDEGARLFLYILSGLIDGLLKYERERPRDVVDDLPARLTRGQIVRRLERRDFVVHSVRYKARRDVYVVGARDPYGARVRLVVDPYTGEILRSRPVG